MTTFLAYNKLTEYEVFVTIFCLCKGDAWRKQ